jgi:hypothetical protein
VLLYLGCPLKQSHEEFISTLYFFAGQVIEDLASSRTGVEADLNTLAGEWQLLWASQVNLYISIAKHI